MSKKPAIWRVLKSDQSLEACVYATNYNLGFAFSTLDYVAIHP